MTNPTDAKRTKAVMHFNKISLQRGGPPWSVHWRGTCFIVREIRCAVPMRSEWKPEKKKNPRAFFTAMIRDVSVRDGVARLR